MQGSQLEAEGHGVMVASALAVNRRSFEPHSRDEAFYYGKVCMEVSARGRIGGPRMMMVMVAIYLLLSNEAICRAPSRRSEVRSLVANQSKKDQRTDRQTDRQTEAGRETGKL